ncbi:preprotein translocase subunit SecE [Peptoniphilus sp. KCTC 25270]|uniref:preprotein translocase subunit SecE n=1 Tax=Peptoniphilus sp. KCTC 25270 TaxID=2897414 RepID=UPI001E3CC21A|nr:preprotein translocase subunit SecE [Peptoniphilus sp. KCTC 25270]MCD1146661.1 preprotein translocase subunit SecE [Peptoniphilus sp. KCTC 25270]
MAAKTNAVNGDKKDSKSLKRYFGGVKSEFKKVIWPSKKDWIRYSLIVIAVSIVTAIFIYAVDFVFSQIVSLIIGL